MRWAGIAITVVGVLGSGVARAGFEDDFTGAALRIDYYHSGTAVEEHIALDRVRVEGSWPGSRTRLIDTTNLGKYLVEVVDVGSNRVLYTRGFASIYGEWETTSEARDETWRTIPEAVRIPEPRRPFQVRLRKRGADQSFVEIWSTTIDPASRFVDRARAPSGDVWTVFENGDPAVKVDLLFLGDGYSADQLDEFHSAVERLTEALFAVEPFASRKKDFNVRAVDRPSAQSGIARPRAGVLGDPSGRALQLVRLGALRPDPRRPWVARRRRGRPVRVRRDPGQRAQVWRRRYLQPVLDRRRGLRFQ